MYRLCFCSVFSLAVLKVGQAPVENIWEMCILLFFLAETERIHSFSYPLLLWGASRVTAALAGLEIPRAQQQS